MRIALTLLFMTAGLWAQPPRNFFPWWDNPVVRDLNLTPNQRQHVRGIVREYRAKLADARASVLNAENELDAALNEDQLNNARAMDAARKLGAARQQLTTTFAEMSVRLRGQLTADQWKELQKRRNGKPLGGLRRLVPADGQNNPARQ